MHPQTHFQTLARYNLWATRRLLEAIAVVPDADYRRDVGLFFQSIHGTLNHLLLGEHLLWRTRFADGVSPLLALDAQVEPDRAALAQCLLEGAQAWLPLMATWAPARFEGSLHYISTRGQALSLPFAATLTHVFNHGTHHCGQVTAALTALGHPCPELDLVALLQAEQTH